MNCMVRPMAMLGLAGVTAIDCKIAAVTVSVVFPDLLPEVAVMTEVPTPTPVARPPGFTIATPIAPDDQMTDAVMSCEVPSV